MQHLDNLLALAFLRTRPLRVQHAIQIHIPYNRQRPWGGWDSAALRALSGYSGGASLRWATDRTRWRSERFGLGASWRSWCDVSRRWRYTQSWISWTPRSRWGISRNYTAKFCWMSRPAIISAYSSLDLVRITTLKSGVHFSNSHVQFCRIGLGTTIRCGPEMEVVFEIGEEGAHLEGFQRPYGR